jgi:short-subunit dehydrogenase
VAYELGSSTVAVVTGATSGIDRATVHAFARLGTRVALVARDEDDLHVAAAEAIAFGAARTLTCPADISDEVAVVRARDAVIAEFGRIDVWVNAAALLVAGDLPGPPVDDSHRLIETNVWGMLVASRTALEQFREQRGGVLVNVSSVLGVIPSPLVPTYTMTKFAVRGLSLSLHHLSAAWPGVHVCVVLPGPVDTPMFRSAANLTGRRLRAIPPATSPDRVAAAIVRCARRPRRQVAVGWLAKTIVFAGRVSPRLTEWVVARASANLLLTNEHVPPTPGATAQPAADARQYGGWRRGRMRRRVGDALGRVAGLR